MDKKEYMADSSSDDEELEFLDEAIIYAWENKQQEFVEAIETFLEEFVLDKERQEEMIGNVNRFQRKVIHQLCERVNVVRTYVDIKNNSDNASVTIQKTSTSEVPEHKVRYLYSRHLARAQKALQKQQQTMPPQQQPFVQQQQQQMQMQQQQMQMMQQMMIMNGGDPHLMQQMFMQQQFMAQQQKNLYAQQMSVQTPSTLSQVQKQTQMHKNHQQYQQQQAAQDNKSNTLPGQKPKNKVNINQIINQEEEFPSL